MRILIEMSEQQMDVLDALAEQSGKAHEEVLRGLIDRGFDQENVANSPDLRVRKPAMQGEGVRPSARCDGAPEIPEECDSSTWAGVRTLEDFDAYRHSIWRERGE